MLSWLCFWRRRGRTRLVVRLFTRQGCHLCETAWQLLEQSRTQWGFDLTAIDVDTSPELIARYGDCVPVVTVNDKVRFRGTVNGVLLQRLLKQESR
jgi:glutaredoxin